VTRTQGRATFKLWRVKLKKNNLEAKIQKIKQIRGKNYFILFFFSSAPAYTLRIHNGAWHWYERSKVFGKRNVILIEKYLCTTMVCIIFLQLFILVRLMHMDLPA